MQVTVNSVVHMASASCWRELVQAMQRLIRFPGLQTGYGQVILIL